MDRPPELISILWISALPLLAAALGLVFGPWLGRRPGRRASVSLRLAIGSTALAGLLLGGAVESLLRDPPVARLGEVIGGWLAIGTTTTLRLELALDRLAALVAGPLVVIAFLGQFAGLMRPRALLLISAALAGGLLLVTAKSLILVALGWQLIGLVALAAGHPSRGQNLGQVPDQIPDQIRSQIRGFAVADGAFWLAIALLGLGAGALDVGQVLRTTLVGEGSRFAVGEFAGIPLAALCGAGLTVAVIARGLAMPAPRGPHATLAAVLAGPLSTLIGAYLLLRMGAVLAADPAILPAIALVGAGLAVIGGIRAVRAATASVALGRLTHAHLGLVVAAIGVHAWSAALAVAIVGALALAALGIVAGSIDAGDRHHPWTRAGAAIACLALAGATPLGILPPLASVAAAGWGAGAAGLAVTAAALAYAALAALALARAHRRLFADEGGRGGDEALIAGPAALLALAALAAGAASLPPLPGLLGFGDGPLLTPFLGPSLYQVQTFAPIADPGPSVSAGLALALLAAALFGAFLGWRGPLPDATERAGGLGRALAGFAARGSALLALPLAVIDGSSRLGGHLRERAYLRIWLSATTPGGGVLLGLFAGMMAVLGAIYCNPEVVVVGPTGVHPVDLGGLRPRITAPQGRSGLAAMPTPNSAPPTEVQLPPAPPATASPVVPEEYR